VATGGSDSTVWDGGCGGGRQALNLRAASARMALRIPAFALFLLISLAACGVRQPDLVFGPTDIGVIESVEGIRNAEQAVTFDDGERLVIDFGGGATANDVPGTPRTGQLLIYAADVGGKPWVLLLSGQGDCFMIQGRATDTGDDLVFESGLKLRKAVDYDSRGLPGPPTEYTSDQARFCVNSDGVITNYAG
jgi:predicted small lipoprotein YifL